MNIVFSHMRNLCIQPVNCLCRTEDNREWPSPDPRQSDTKCAGQWGQVRSSAGEGRSHNKPWRRGLGWTLSQDNLCNTARSVTCSTEGCRNGKKLELTQTRLNRCTIPATYGRDGNKVRLYLHQGIWPARTHTMGQGQQKQGDLSQSLTRVGVLILESDYWAESSCFSMEKERWSPRT